MKIPPGPFIPKKPINIMIEILFAAGVIAFILQFFDASIGMGFGEITVIIILLGFSPLEAIPAVILSSAVLSLFAGISHHTFKNVDISLDGKELKITSILSAFGLIAISIGTIVAISIPTIILEAYIGVLVIFLGVLVTVKISDKRGFSWKKLISIGSIAAFNKGISGGGYGPVLAGGQIISGVKPRKIAGITAFTEGIVSLFGAFLFFMFAPNNFNVGLILALVIGGLISTPIAAYYTSRMNSSKLKKSIGFGIIVLGVLFLLKIIFS